jgi:hypothetical protein
LVEEMIFTFVIKQSIGIINPVLCRGEVSAWAKFFIENTGSLVRLHGAYLILII